MNTVCIFLLKPFTTRNTKKYIVNQYNICHKLQTIANMKSFARNAKMHMTETNTNSIQTYTMPTHKNNKIKWSLYVIAETSSNKCTPNNRIPNTAQTSTIPSATLGKIPCSTRKGLPVPQKSISIKLGTSPDTAIIIVPTFSDKQQKQRFATGQLSKIEFVIVLILMDSFRT